MRSHLLALVLIVVSVAPRRAAEACGNARYYTLDQLTRKIADAEAALEKGNYRAAMNALYRVDVYTGPPSDVFERNAPRLVPTPQRRALERRLKRVMAIAHLRLGYSKSARWMLEPLVKRAPDDPALQARYAEALAATGYLKRARAILVDLQQRDLIPDAFAWRALARLHDGAGEVEARDRAITACKAIAPDAAECTLAKAAKPPKAAAKR